MPPLMSPGAMATQGILEVLQQRDQEKRQALLDSLGVAREARDQQNQQWQHEDRQFAIQDRLRTAAEHDQDRKDALDLRKSQHDDKVAEDFQKTYTKGDYVPPDMDPAELDMLKKRGVIYGQTESAPGPANDPSIQGPVRPAALRVTGTSAQALAQHQQQSWDDLINEIGHNPGVLDDPQQRVAYELRAQRLGKTIPPALLKPPMETEDVYSQGVDGAITKVGTVPKGAHFTPREPTPPRDHYTPVVTGDGKVVSFDTNNGKTATIVDDQGIPLVPKATSGFSIQYDQQTGKPVAVTRGPDGKVVVTPVPEDLAKAPPSAISLWFRNMMKSLGVTGVTDDAHESQVDSLLKKYGGG